MEFASTRFLLVHADRIMIVLNMLFPCSVFRFLIYSLLLVYSRFNNVWLVWFGFLISYLTFVCKLDVI